MGSLFASVTTIVVAVCVVNILCCDLSYLCNQGNYHVINPEPMRYTSAKAEGCETVLSVGNEYIVVRMCKTAPVVLELHGINGDNLACNLSCGATRKRRSTGWQLTSLATVMAHGVSDKVCHYACHKSGLFFDNPRPELYNFVSAYSLSDMTKCKYDPQNYNKVIWLYQCPLEGEVLISLSKKSEEGISIERYKNLMIVDCSPALPLEEPYRSGDSRDVTFSCFEDGMITVVNPRRELWRYSYAVNNNVECESTLLGGGALIIIFNCPQVDLTVLVLDKTQDASEIILRNNNFYIIDCTT